METPERRGTLSLQLSIRLRRMSCKDPLEIPRQPGVKGRVSTEGIEGAYRLCIGGQQRVFTGCLHFSLLRHWQKAPPSIRITQIMAKQHLHSAPPIRLNPRSGPIVPHHA